MFQAWQSVKVTTEGSEFTGQAGYVIRTEQEGEKAIVFVRLDSDSAVHTFGTDELALL